MKIDALRKDLYILAFIFHYTRCKRHDIEILVWLERCLTTNNHGSIGGWCERRKVKIDIFDFHSITRDTAHNNQKKAQGIQKLVPDYYRITITNATKKLQKDNSNNESKS